MIVYPVISPIEEAPSFARICRAFRVAMPFLDRPQIIQTVRGIADGEYITARVDEAVDDPSVWELRRALFSAGAWIKRHQVETLADWARVAAYQELRRRANAAHCDYIPPANLMEFARECWPERAREDGMEANRDT